MIHDVGRVTLGGNKQEKNREYQVCVYTSNNNKAIIKLEWIAYIQVTTIKAHQQA